jgi:hypothetical protein
MALIPNFQQFGTNLGYLDRIFHSLRNYSHGSRILSRGSSFLSPPSLLSFSP